MTTLRTIPVLAALLVAATGPAAWAQAPCPPEVAEAEKLLAAIKTARPARSAAGARGQDVQAPRGQDVQAPRGQDVQAPREQDVQAPRGQDVQAPRGQDVQAPRGQDVQAPRGQDVQAPRSRGQDVQAPRGDRAAVRARKSTMDTATRLVREARKACNAADAPRASANARAALELLGYLQ